MRYVCSCEYHRSYQGWNEYIEYPITRGSSKYLTYPIASPSIRIRWLTMFALQQARSQLNLFRLEAARGSWYKSVVENSSWHFYISIKLILSHRWCASASITTSSEWDFLHIIRCPVVFEGTQYSFHSPGFSDTNLVQSEFISALDYL